MTISRFHEIDLLRGCACSMVVAFHYLYRGQLPGWISSHAHPVLEAVARYGYLGVHLFFIISGFVIFMSAQNSTARSFVASRVARLYPAFWVAAPLTALTIWWLGGAVFQVSAAQLAVNMTMAPHWFGVDFVDGVYWSLAVELHFYILVTLMVAIDWTRHVQWLLAGWLLLSAINWVRPMYPLELWLCAKWAPLFSAGVCAYLIRAHGASARRLCLLAGAYLLAMAYALKDVAPATGESRFVTGLMITTFFALFIGIAFDRWRLRPSAWVLWAGLMTYPVYLLHQFIGYLLLEAMVPYLQSLYLRLLVVCTLIGLGAWAIVRWIERPLMPRMRQLLGKGRLQPASAR